MPLACRHGLLAHQVVHPLEELHQGDDRVKNLDKTFQEEQPGDTAVPEGTIDGDADAAADWQAAGGRDCTVGQVG